MGLAMFHMLVCFNLKPEVEIDQFQRAISTLTEHLHGLDLAQGVSAIGKRQSDTPLDTDRERSHEYFVTVSFRDRDQSDSAYRYLKAHAEPGESIHKAVYSRVANPVFICWNDL
jgi:hypothetical protein